MDQDIVTYSPGLKFFHWLIAIIVIAMLAGSFFLGSVPELYRAQAYLIHKSFGLTVLFLMVLRVIWILSQGKPALPATVPVWQRILARGVQHSLYLFLFAMPLSGWIMSVSANKMPYYFGLFPVPLPITPDKALAGFMSQTHTVIAYIIIGLLVLHIAGALKHYFIDKDNVLQSMLPKK